MTRALRLEDGVTAGLLTLAPPRLPFPIGFLPSWTDSATLVVRSRPFSFSSRMTRASRLEHPGAIWHLTSRGNERRDIFRSDRRRFLEILADVIDLHRWVLSAWVAIPTTTTC